MSHKPVAAGKSSFDLIDTEKAFSIIDVKPSTKFLDLACGVGRYSLVLAGRIGPKGTVYAVDLWEEGIEALDREIKLKGIRNIKTLVADISGRLPLDGASIDSCLIATVLHDLSKEDRNSAVQEAARLLRPGGMLNIIEFKKVDRGPGPPVAQKMDEAETEALVSPYGFTKVAIDDLGEFSYLLKFEKHT